MTSRFFGLALASPFLGIAAMLVPTAASAANFGTDAGCAFLANTSGPPLPAVDSPAYFTGKTIAGKDLSGDDWICQLQEAGGDRFSGKCKTSYSAYALDMTISLVAEGVKVQFDGNSLPYTLNRCPQ